MVNQKKKPAKLMWTQAWRRLNKKGKEEGLQRKRCLSNKLSLLDLNLSLFPCAERGKLLRFKEQLLALHLRR